MAFSIFGLAMSRSNGSWSCWLKMDFRYTLKCRFIGRYFDVTELPTVHVERCQGQNAIPARLSGRLCKEAAQEVVSQTMGAARIEEPRKESRMLGLLPRDAENVEQVEFRQKVFQPL